MPVNPRLLLKNALLMKLARADFEIIARHLEAVTLEANHVLYDSQGTIDYVYFLTDGVISKVQTTEGGAGIAIGMVGNEGMVGACVHLESNVSPFRATVQVAGEALRMSGETFYELTARNGPLAKAVRRYLYGYLNMVSQIAACNRLHSIERRCCRWLLMTRDRVSSDRFPLTHESLALMLGASRPTITTVARKLKEAGLINYQWGEVLIRDRRGLEKAACVCYSSIRKLFAPARGA